MIYINKISRSFLLLIISFTCSYASFQPIYDFKNENFKYSLENNNYKVVLKDVGYISKQTKGFKLYLPFFVKDYNLEILRVSSIGHIDGYLSNKINFNDNNVLNVRFYDLNYYLTDYKEKDLRQLDFLLKSKVIPYKNATSIVIEGYNIPYRINKRLNKWLYFIFDKQRENRLKELSYSFSMVLDKKAVDSYVKRNFVIKDYPSNKFKFIHTYLENLNSQKKNYFVNKNIPKPKVKFSLDKKREYTFKSITGISNTIKELYDALENEDLKSQKDLIHYNIGVLYAKKNSIKSNKKAIWHFKNSKLKESYFNLGVYYYLGLATKENDKKAYAYFKKSSNLGFKRAHNNIRIMEEFRIGL